MRPKVFRKVDRRKRSFGQILVTLSAVVRLAAFLVGVFVPSEIAVSEGEAPKSIAIVVLDTVGEILDDLMADLK